MRPFEPLVGWSHSLWAKVVQRIRAAAFFRRHTLTAERFGIGFPMVRAFMPIGATDRWRARRAAPRPVADTPVRGESSTAVTP